MKRLGRLDRAACFVIAFAISAFPCGLTLFIARRLIGEEVTEGVDGEFTPFIHGVFYGVCLRLYYSLWWRAAWTRDEAERRLCQWHMEQLSDDPAAYLERLNWIRFIKKEEADE